MTDTEDLETDIDIDDIGTILKSSRLKSKKSMEEISSELCIRKIYLTALEEGDYDTLPPIPYGVGYIRTYARYLGLNPERAVQLYKAASMREDTTETEEEIITAPEANKSNMWHIVIGIIILAVIYGGWSLYAADMEQKAEDNTVVEDQLAAEETSDAENAALSEKTTTEEASDKTEVETESKMESSTEDKTVEKNEKESSDSEQTSASKNEKPFVAPADKIIFKFSGESWIEVKNRKKVYFQGVYHDGDVKEMPYEPNLFVSIGRPKNLTMFIKGEKKQIFSTKHKMNILLDSIK